ncbi:hypothetical protein KY321_04420 [Candidatus Woesearchaeota archaeon]|nr:hypothetical protein [Candidatus Woesearchaeota archaeon]
MEAIGEMDDKEKTEYLIRTSSTINLNDTFREVIEQYGIEEILNFAYEALLKTNESVVDSIGIWVEYDGEIYENSIKLKTLEDMKKYSDEDISPIYEFFKLSS